MKRPLQSLDLLLDSQSRNRTPILRPCPNSSSASPPTARPCLPVPVVSRNQNDGYRLCVERGGDRVRLITCGGHDWGKRYPWIVEAALKNKQKRFVIDGEAVILGIDGISDFNALYSGNQNDGVRSAPSTCWRWTGRICASCLYQCARQNQCARKTWNGSCGVNGWQDLRIFGAVARWDESLGAI